MSSIVTRKNVQGLQIVDASNQQDSTEKDENVLMADGRPIPLHYEALQKADGPAKLLPLTVRLPHATDWPTNLTRLYLARAMKLFELLGDISFKLGRYGRTLRYVKHGFLCYGIFV